MWWRWDFAHPPVSLVVALAAIGLLSAGNALAKDHTVGSGTSSVDCRNYGGGVSPGDTLIISSGGRGSLEFENCFGTSSNPITDSPQLVGAGTDQRVELVRPALPEL